MVWRTYQIHVDVRGEGLDKSEMAMLYTFSSDKKINK